MKTLGTITNEGYICTINEDEDGRVFYNADGANGQNGGPVAYKNDNIGMEALANGGMAVRNGKVVCAKPWARDIVILDKNNEPRILPGGIIKSMTWYRHPGKPADDPAAYVDSEIVSYIVVPPLIIQRTKEVVRGCRAKVTRGDRSVECVVADKDPGNKIGELSIAAARAIGLPSSRRSGGTEKPELLYELWPGEAASGYQHS